MRIDLHCHSTYSDGKHSVEEILEKAETLGIKVLCISDHDNLHGSAHAIRLGSGIFSGMLIPGIEISTNIQTRTTHLLAYFPDIKQVLESPLSQNLEKIKASRVTRMKQMVEKARQGGFDIQYDEVLAEAAGTKDGSQPTDVISRPHIARVFIKKGYAESVDDAFNRFFGEGKPFHVSRLTYSFSDWINLIHGAGGIVSWAHPLFGKENSISILREISSKLINRIDGIEVYYKYEGKYDIEDAFKEEGTKFLFGLCDKYDLLKTGGGDFHGDVGELGAVSIPREDWERFKAKLFSNQSNLSSDTNIPNP